MSLYNMLFGVNPATPILMAALNLDNEAPENWSERLSALDDGWNGPDIHSEEGRKLMAEAIGMGFYPTGRFRDIYFENEGEPKIILYTRNGGGNRDWYEYVFELLSKHPLYITDYDDDFDCTYAYIEFKAPDSVVKFFDGIKTGKMESVSQKFEKEIKAMSEGKQPPAEIMKMVEQIAEALK